MTDFLKQTNIYEVNLRQYTPEGTILSFMKHLPRLRDMGVEILWMMPIHPIGSIKRKGSLGSYYSIRDFYEINPEFGTKEDFRLLVETVHANGMKIIIDWVANHAAWDNTWTVTHPSFFVQDVNGNFKPPYDWDDVIQFDHSNKEKQATMIDAMVFWIREFQIDGFRADLAHLTPLTFWLEARRETDKIKPGTTWLAETEDVDYFQAFDIVYAWKWMHATEEFLKHNQPAQVLIDLLLRQREILPAEKRELFFTSNHDENSWNGTEYEKYGIYAKALAVFNYVHPEAVPLIYSGQELPNVKRLKFFEKDVIDWQGEAALHDFYKILNAFHLNNFSAGEMALSLPKNDLLLLTRTKDQQQILLFLNLGKTTIAGNIDLPGSDGNYKNIFTGEMISVKEYIAVDLNPGDFLLLKK